MLLPLAALLALALPAVAGADDVPPGVVSVRGGVHCGTGFVWDAGAGLVLTALHVVEQMPDGDLEIVLTSGEVLAARVADREPALDLAILKVAGPLPEPALELAHDSPAPGSAIALAACPAGSCGLAPGLVLDPSRSFAGARYLSLATDARPGSSGAPVLGAGGAVVGVVDLVLRSEPGIALAVPIGAAAARFPRADPSPADATRVTVRSSGPAAAVVGAARAAGSA